MLLLNVTDSMFMSRTGVAGNARRLWLRLMSGRTPTAEQGREKVRPAKVRAVSVSVWGPGMGGWKETVRSRVSPERREGGEGGKKENETEPVHSRVLPNMRGEGATRNQMRRYKYQKGLGLI